MIKFSEFYGPERQQELLQEAKNRRFSQAALADQHNHTSKEENKMYSRISIAFIVVGLFVGGFAIFNSSVTQAAPPCATYSSATLAANPELLKINCNEVTVEAETNVQRANEAYSARYQGLAEFYTGATGTIDSSYQAANPELNVVRRYEAAAKMTDSASLAANPELMIFNRYKAQVAWQRKHFPGR